MSNMVGEYYIINDSHEGIASAPHAVHYDSTVSDEIIRSASKSQPRARAFDMELTRFFQMSSAGKMTMSAGVWREGCDDGR